MSVVGESVHIPGPLAKLRVAARAEPSLASVGDYLALMKPRVMSLVVFTGSSASFWWNRASACRRMRCSDKAGHG